MADFPSEGMELTHIMVVTDVDRARDWYRDVLGAAIHREYGGTSVVINFQGSWLLLVTGGKPTKDKPDVTFTPLDGVTRVNHAMTIRVPDCQSAYKILKDRGAEFLSEPVNWEYEIRAFFRDPGGHLFEISQVENLPKPSND